MARFNGTNRNDNLTGSQKADQMYGDAGDDTLFGGDGADLLDGGLGSDWLDGGLGADTLRGGAGNDTYVVDSGFDLVSERLDEGSDTVRSSVDYALGANLEHLTLVGAALIGTGNELDNLLLGNASDNVLSAGAGHDTLDGGAGADVLIGGSGDDTYMVDAAGDVVTENAGEGNDTVRASITYTLGADVEHLTLTGAAAIDGAGNALNNAIFGNAGANRLDGGSGADSMVGGAGDDLYVVDATGDVVTEAADGGIDTVEASISYTLGGGVEKLALIGTAAINGTGNALDNRILGNSANNRLDGGIGADSMTGGAGNDTYVVDSTGDVAIEEANAGTDTVQASVSHVLGAHIENLTLIGNTAIDATGNALNNVLTGNAGANRLDGGIGNDTIQGGSGDTLLGGAGNDAYTVNGGSAIVENADEGIDTVQSSGSYTLSANVENLTLTGYGGIGYGNDQDNVLIGNLGGTRLMGGAGNDTLDGGSHPYDPRADRDGPDTLVGGTGNDTYMVYAENHEDETFDLIVEYAGEGVDTVVSNVVIYTLGANFENLKLSSQAGYYGLVGTGNGADNLLVGNQYNNTLNGLAGNDTLDGGTGSDRLYGGIGNDTYAVDSAGDSVVENYGEGTDTVLSSISYVLGATVENLTLTGAATNGSGNGLNNVLTGNDGANALSGGAGNDTLDGSNGNDLIDGGAGDDVLDGGAGSDVFVFAVGTQTDIVRDFATGQDRLDLTAFAFADVAAVKAQMSDSASGVALDLANGDVVILSGVTVDNLGSADFLL